MRSMRKNAAVYHPLAVSSKSGSCHDKTAFCCLTTTRTGFSLKAVLLVTCTDKA